MASQCDYSVNPAINKLCSHSNLSLTLHRSVQPLKIRLMEFTVDSFSLTALVTGRRRQELWLLVCLLLADWHAADFWKQPDNLSFYIASKGTKSRQNQSTNRVQSLAVKWLQWYTEHSHFFYPRIFWFCALVFAQTSCLLLRCKPRWSS